MMVNTFLMIFTNRWLGHFSDRFGERLLLVLTSLALVFIFAGYAYITFLPALIVAYVIDNVLFGSSVALKSYISKIASQKRFSGDFHRRRGDSIHRYVVFVYGAGESRSGKPKEGNILIVSYCINIYPKFTSS